MSLIIEVIVSPRGEATIETKGFAGAACRDASRFLEQTLGIPVGEQLSAELHLSQAAQVSQVRN